LSALDSRGIYRVTLPKLNTPDNIITTVWVIGQILGNRSEEGGTDAPARAEAYAVWYRGLLSDVGSRVTRFNYEDIDFSNDRYTTRTEQKIKGGAEQGYYTLFIEGWDEAASYRIYSDRYLTLQGSGMAVAPSGYSTSPLSYHLSMAGVVNTAAIYADLFRLCHWYVTPLSSSTRTVDVTGPDGERCRNQLLSVPIYDESRRVERTYYLGNEVFPAVIAASAAIKDAIQADAENGGMWTEYGMVTSADARTRGYGFLDEIGQLVSTAIHGDYRVLVLPSGAGSWSAGSAEGPLAAIWTAMEFYGAFSEQELREYIRSFYREFYLYEIDDVQINGILAGA
jgi:hypothetical protein